MTGTTSLSKTVRVRNYSNTARTYAVSTSFRFADDVANGAVTISAPASVSVGANADATFTVTARINPAGLRAWALNSGPNGANADLLSSLEYDGYVWLDDQGTANDNADPAHLPWQVLPRAAAYVTLGSGGTSLGNAGQAADLELYSLMAVSADDPASSVPGDNLSDADFKAVGVATYAAGEDGCSWIYAINASTWERQSHANAPVLFEFDIDVDRDGTADYAVYNRDQAGLAALSDGRNLTFVQNLETGDEDAFFYVDHTTNSSNTVLLFCSEQIGLGMDDVGLAVDVAGLAVDFYTSGTVRDDVEFEAVFGGERYYGLVDGSPFFASIGAGASEPFQVLDAGAAGAGLAEQGVLIRVINGTAATDSLTVPVGTP